MIIYAVYARYFTYIPSTDLCIAPVSCVLSYVRILRRTSRKHIVVYLLQIKRIFSSSLFLAL